MRIVKGKNFTRTDGDFLLVSLHRSELLSNALVLRQTVSEIILSTNFLPVTIVLDSLTLKALKSEDLIDDLLQSEVTVLQKLPYPDFISLLFRVKLVVTDSGGLQEECAALSIPCLVHRMHTEREDGLGQCVSLSRWVPTAIVEFVEHQMKEAMVPQSEIGISANSPTQIIVKELEKLGFLK
jgi:UDP-N-acetylglucosamine 2-epimerase (non-hydrolysing)